MITLQKVELGSVCSLLTKKFGLLKTSFRRVFNLASSGLRKMFMDNIFLRPHEAMLKTMEKAFFNKLFLLIESLKHLAIPFQSTKQDEKPTCTNNNMIHICSQYNFISIIIMSYELYVYT